MRSMFIDRHGQRGCLMLGLETLMIYMLYWTISFIVSHRLNIAFVASTIGSSAVLLIAGMLTAGILQVQKWVQRFYWRGKER